MDRAIARERLLGATIWAFGGGGVSVHAWTRPDHFSHLLCLNDEPRPDGGTRSCGYCGSTDVDVQSKTDGVNAAYVDYYCRDCERLGTWKEPRSAERGRSV